MTSTELEEEATRILDIAANEAPLTTEKQAWLVDVEAKIEAAGAADEAEAERYLLAAQRMILEGHEMLCCYYARYRFMSEDGEVNDRARRAACDAHQDGLNRKRQAIPRERGGGAPSKGDAYWPYYEEYRKERDAGRGGAAVVTKCCSELGKKQGAVRQAFRRLRNPNSNPKLGNPYSLW
jgi:hypothetical protein